MGVALNGFKESLKLATSLRKIEREKYTYQTILNQPFIMGLRGGAAVLMVASFELFLRRLFEEHISKLNTSPPTVDFQKLPDKLKVKIVFDGLENSMKGKKFEPKKEKIDRVSDVLTACRHLIGEHINPAIFSETNGNPNSNTVKDKFKEIGIENIFL